MSKHGINCSLIQWIVEAETRLASGKTPLSQVIANTCSQKSLERKNFGVTLLFPVDIGYREELLKRTETGKQDDYENAQLEFLTLVMPEAVVDASELTSPERYRKPDPNESGPLGNWLGEVYTFEKSGSEYVLKIEGKEYATITNEPPKALKDLQTHYIPKNPLLKTQGKYSVWFMTLKPGVTKLPFDKNIQQKYQRKGVSRTGNATGKPRVEGGGEQINSMDLDSLDRRFILAKQLEAEFAKQMKTDQCQTHHPYLPVVTSLLNYIRAQIPDLYAKVLHVVDYDPFITFYLLFEPYKRTGEFLISNRDLYGSGAAWSHFCLSKNPKQEYLDHINNKHGVSLPIFTDSKEFQSKVKVAKSHVVTNAKPYTILAKTVKDIYKAFIEGKGHGMDKAPFGSTCTAADVDRRIWQDEFRFHISSALGCTLAHGKFDIHEYEILLNHIEFGWPGNNHSAELVSVCTDSTNKIITSAEVGLLKGFVSSTDFLYFPICESQLDSETIESAYDDDEIKTVVNRNYKAHAALVSIKQRETCKLEDIISAAQNVLNILGK